MLIGGFHVSGMYAMVGLTSDLRDAMSKGMILVAGEVEGERLPAIIRDVLLGAPEPFYNYLTPTPDLSDLPIPRLTKEDFKGFASSYSTLDTGRGCVFTCDFCTIINVQGRTMRCRDPKQVVEFVRQNYRDSGVAHAFFTDDNIARNPRWRELFLGLASLREEEHIPFTFMMQSDLAAKKMTGGDFFTLASRAGCDQVFFGVESVNRENLRSQGKYQNQVSGYKDLVDHLHGLAMAAHAGYILGLHAGTDVANYRTNARIVDDRVILKGTKTLISRAKEAGMFVVFTRIDGKPGREGIGCVLVEPDTKGFAVTGTYHTMGGENLHEIQFDDCELPLENLVIRDDGFRKLLTAFNTQRCLNPSISLGLAEGAFDEAVNYVRERTVFGKPISDFQGIRWKLADMFKDIEAGRGLLYRACLSANPFPDPFMAAAAKIFCNEMSLRVTTEAVQVHGGFGFTDEFPVSRFYRGARYGSIGGGASETLRDLIGKKIVGEFDPADGIMGFGIF